MLGFLKRKTAEVFYCRHITQGISAYKEGNTLITKECLDDMNETFTGKPVVITHKDWDKQIPVGYVVKSFYLPQDGYFWAEFIIDNENALNLIKNQNFRVSNGYKVIQAGVGGRYHDIEYSEEVVKGEYLHLALTNEPKFEEAIILDRKSFKQFKHKLDKIDNKYNSKEEEEMIFFTKKKVDNSEEILNSSFELQGKEFTVKGMIDILNEKLNEGEKKYVCCDGEFTAEELVSKYNECKANEEAKKKEEEEKAKKEAEEKAKKENEEKEKKEKEEAEKKENERIAEEQKKLNERMLEAEKAKAAIAEEYQLNENGMVVKIEK